MIINGYEYKQWLLQHRRIEMIIKRINKELEWKMMITELKNN